MDVDTEGALSLTPVKYSELNPKQQEIYNFHTVAALLMGCGFECVRLANDWGGADFLAYPKEAGQEILRIQLKGRPTIDKKYQDPEKKIYMAFPIDEVWYLIPHNKLLQLAEVHTKWTNTKSWNEVGIYHSPAPPQNFMNALIPFQLQPLVGTNRKDKSTKELKKRID
jgi:hypothetical protein